MRCDRGVEVITVITALFFAGSDQMSCNAGIKHVTVGNSGVIWTRVGGLTISRSRHPFRTAYLCVFTPSSRSRAAARTSASVPCVLLRTVRSMCITPPWQNRRSACAFRRTRQSPRQQHSQGGKGTDICSLSFGHSLSLLSYSTSKLTLLHSNAAPAPPPNWASSIGSTCKTF